MPPLLGLVLYIGTFLVLMLELALVTWLGRHFTTSIASGVCVSKSLGFLASFAKKTWCSLMLSRVGRSSAVMNDNTSTGKDSSHFFFFATAIPLLTTT